MRFISSEEINRINKTETYVNVRIGHKNIKYLRKNILNLAYMFILNPEIKCIPYLG